MTISEIKEATRGKSPYFFTKNSMRFFNQRMSNFKVKTSPKGNIYIYAPSYWDNRLMGYTFREYKDGDLHLITGINKDSLDDILDYIKEN